MTAPTDTGPDGRPVDWRDLALCAQVDLGMFYPRKGQSPGPAKKICRGCEVRAECLAFALEHDEQFGVWGATSAHERRTMKRRQRARKR